MASTAVTVTDQLLAGCDLCGCLVEAATLRAREYYQEARHRTYLVCEDPVSCYARTDNLGRWRRAGAEIPLGREPALGTPLARCLLCDIAATIDELIITRVRDDDGVWFTDVICTDEDACLLRQYEEAARIERSPPS